MNPEPKWKTFLNWSAVITWFSMPLFIFTLQFLSDLEWLNWFHFNQHISEYKWVAAYYRDLTILVFSLAGLQVADHKIPDRK